MTNCDKNDLNKIRRRKLLVNAGSYAIRIAVKIIISGKLAALFEGLGINQGFVTKALIWILAYWTAQSFTAWLQTCVYANLLDENDDELIEEVRSGLLYGSDFINMIKSIKQAFICKIHKDSK